MAASARTLRLLNTSAARIRRTTAEVDREMTRRYAAEWSRLSRSLETRLRSLAKSSKRDWPSRAELRSSKGLQDDLARMASALDRLTARSAVLVDGALAEALTSAVSEQTDLVASQLPPSWRPGLAEALDPRLAARIEAGRRRARVLLNRIPGQTAREVRRAVEQPVPPTTVAAMVRAVVEKVRQRFFSGLSRTLTVAGTEVMDAHRTGAALGAAAHEDVLSGWIWIARLDARTCPACLALHGTVFPLDRPGPLGHARCRCIRAPKTKSWKELGFEGFDEPDEPEVLAGEADKWFWSLPERDQLRIMGPSRLALLRSGDVGWSDLFVLRKNEGWRDAYTVRPVRDLRR